ncbi:TadE/TadG family type IV pilus assembly protein [Brevundimonas sp.]|uniref:TadE/TadG family type IV pilus assembly protein n=1 Tax=Brevundimonas sp. TaxID=1871086 RepID=UPI00391B76D7
MERTSSTRRGLGRFRRDQSGATAIEFAFVAAPFFLMMFALIELGVLFVVDVALESAVSQTGRLVRTGQAHERAMSVSEFKEAVCGRMGVFESQCDERLLVDVRVIPRFTGQTPPDPLDENGELSESGLRFAIGGPGDIILLSAWYPQPLFTPLVSQGAERVAGHRVLNVTTAFRNEPFNPVAPAQP